jgi:hypothetical protein
MTLSLTFLLHMLRPCVHRFHRVDAYATVARDYYTVRRRFRESRSHSIPDWTSVMPLR